MSALPLSSTFSLASWNSQAAVWAACLWHASWQGGLFIAVVWLLCRLLPRLPAQARHWLWWLACLKLGLGLLALPAVPVFLPLAAPPPVPAPSVVVTYSVPSEPFTSAPISMTSVPLPVARRHMARPSRLLILEGIWLIGVFGVLLLTGHQLFRLRRLLARSEPLPEGFWPTELLAMAHKMGVRCLPRLRVSADAPAPLLALGWRPCLILPSALRQEASPDQARLVLAHELAHLRRGDLWRSLVPLVIGALFWFHPLLWLARREEELAREEACDAWVLQATGVAPAQYARLLLRLEAGSGRVGLPALGMSSGYKSLRRRLETLKRLPTQPPRGRRSVFVVIALGLLVLIPWRVQAERVVTRPSSRPTAISLVVSAQTLPLPPVSPGRRPLSPAVSRLAPLPVSPQKGQPSMKMPTLSKPHAVAAAALAFAAAGGTPLTAGDIPAPSPAAVSVPWPTTGVVSVPAPAFTAADILPATGVPSPVADPAPADSAGPSVSLDVANATVRDVLKTLFRNRQLSYTIDEGVGLSRITLTLRNVPFEAALHTVLGAAKPPMTYTIENGVYHFQAAQVDPSSPYQYQKIVLQNVLASELIKMLHWDDKAKLPDGVKSIDVLVPDNDLLVEATTEGFAQVKEILKIVDVPARQIQIRTSFAVVSADEVKAAGLTLTDHPDLDPQLWQKATGDKAALFLSKLELEKQITLAPNVTTTNNVPAIIAWSSTQSTYMLKFGVTPRINSDGSVTLRVEPTFSFPAASAAKDGSRTEETVTLLHTLSSGETAVFVRPILSGSNGTELVLFVKPTLLTGSGQ